MANQKPLTAVANHGAEDLTDDYYEESLAANAVDWFSDQASWLISMVFHALILVGLSLVVFNQINKEDTPLLLTDDLDEEKNKNRRN